MTNSKSTKRALLGSAVALLLCFTMLLGTTFAWFTDSATSGNNIIKTGNLDMKLSYKPYGAQNTEWTEVTESTVLFGEDALYEPGYTEAVWLKVENLGSLAFRYDLAINVANEEQGTNKAGEKFSLSDYLEVKYMTIIDSAADFESFYTTRESLDNFAWGGAANSGVASLKDEIAVIKNGVAFSASDATNGAYSSAYVLVVISMPTTVGNEANHNGTDIPEINFSLTAVATQVPNETDSFGSDYDADATYPSVENPIVIPANAVEINAETELVNALLTGGTYVVDSDIEVSSNLTVAADTVLYGTNGNVLTFSNNSKFTVNADTYFEVYGVQMDGEGTYSIGTDGIIYDSSARRTTPLLSTGAGSTLVLGEGTVIENVLAQGSAVVSARGSDDNRAKVILDGATIQNCAGESGTIINVEHAGDVVIEEGTVISGNASYNNNNHGIIRVYNAWDADNPSTVTMNGGEISGNYYSGNGLVGLYYGKMIMNGGKISDNSWFEDNQKHNGFYPIVYVHSNSQFEMNGGEISNNTVRFGVLNCLNSAVEPAIIINGGTVTNNTNTDNNEDAFAAALIEETENGVTKTYKSIFVSANANVSGSVWDYYTGYYTLEEYFEKTNN